MAHLYLAFAHADRDQAERLRRALRRASRPLWLDEPRLKHPESWRAELEDALNVAEALIVLMTEAASASTLVTYEWTWALASGVPVIPVRVGEGALPPRLAQLDPIDLRYRERWSLVLHRLEALNTAEKVRQWLTLLEGADRDERREALDRLLQHDHYRDPAALPGLGKVLAEDPDRRVRLQALSLLEQIGQPAAKLLENVLSDPFSDLRREAAESLDRVARIPFNVAELIAHEPDIPLRQAVVRLLARRSEERALFPFLSDDNDFIRETATRAIVGMRSRTSDLYPPPIIRALARGTQSPDPEARRIALTRLARGGTRTLADLIDDTEHINPAIALTARQALNALGASITRNLIALLGRGDDEYQPASRQMDNNGLRVTAAKQLIRLGQAAEDDLLHALHMPDRNLLRRRNIITTLGLMRSAEAVSPLYNVLDEGDEVLHEAAVRALRRIDTPEARAVLYAWRDHQARQKAAS